MSDATEETPRTNWGESKTDSQSGLKWTDLNHTRPNEGALVHIRGNGNLSSGVYQSNHFEWWKRQSDDPSALVEWAYTSPLMEDMALLSGDVT